jgi:hypothetical protein
VADNIEKARRKGKRLKALERLHQDGNHPVPPAVSASEGYHEEMSKPDTDKGLTPVNHSANRVSEPLTQGHQTPSRNGDHGIGQGRNSAVATGHQDLQQSRVPEGYLLRRLNQVRGNTQDLHLPDTVPGGYSHVAGDIALELFRAADEAGTYSGRQDVNPYPNPARPDDHTARNSATPDNGSHDYSSQVGAASRNPYSAKSIRDIMRENAVEAIAKARA